MDGDDRPRDAGPKPHALYRDVNVVIYPVGLGGPLIELRWIDVNDAPQSRQLSGPDILRMAESHAGLVAALEAVLPWSHATLDINDQARAALAKAEGTPPAPMTRADKAEDPRR